MDSLENWRIRIGRCGNRGRRWRRSDGKGVTSRTVHVWVAMMILTVLATKLFTEVSSGQSGSTGIGLSNLSMYMAYLFNKINLSFTGKNLKLQHYPPSSNGLTTDFSGIENTSSLLSDILRLYARFGLMIMVLLVIGGVESNPGPTSIISPQELASILAKSGHSYDYICKSGLSPFVAIANQLRHAENSKSLAKTLYMRWKKNTGAVQDLFRATDCGKITSEDKLNRDGKENIQATTERNRITRESVLNAVENICPNVDVRFANFNVWDQVMWKKICKEIKCKETKKNRYRIRNIWHSYQAELKNRDTTQLETECRQGPDQRLETEMDVTDENCRIKNIGSSYQSELQVADNAHHELDSIQASDHRLEIEMEVIDEDYLNDDHSKTVTHPRPLVVEEGFENIECCMRIADSITKRNDTSVVNLEEQSVEFTNLENADTSFKVMEYFAEEFGEVNDGNEAVGKENYCAHRIGTRDWNDKSAYTEERNENGMDQKLCQIESQKTFTVDDVFVESDVESDVEVFFQSKKSLASLTSSKKITENEVCEKRNDCFEGSFFISTPDWNLIEKSKGNFDLKWLKYCIKKAAAPIFKKCVINFKTHRKNKESVGTKTKKNETPIIVYYGKCKFDACKNFVFTLYKMKNGPAELRVFSNGVFNHVGTVKTSQLREYERIITQEELARRKPLAYRTEQIQNIDERAVQSYLNCSDVKSIDVYQKAKSEAAQLKDKAKDDFTDLYLQMTENKEDNKAMKLIQEIAYPLKVSMFSKDQLQTLMSSGNARKKFVLHIDSTGSVVRPLKDIFKTIYYYSGCINLDGKILSVMDFISAQHDIGTISSFFMRYLNFQKSITKRQLFSHIVIDYSQALLQSIIFSWNKMTVLKYINLMHNVCNTDKFKINKLVTVHLCCSHFMHMVSRDLAQLSLSKSMKKRILLVMATLINTQTYEEFKKKVFNMLIIFKSKNITDTLKNAVEKLDKEENDLELPDEELTDDSVKTSNLPIYKSSRFYVDGKMIEKAVEDTLKDDNKFETKEKNPCKNDTFCDLFLNRYMPFAPLWTGIVIKHSPLDKNDTRRFSNSIIENWFNMIKGSVLERQTGLKVGRFVQLLGSRISSICKEISLKIPKAACNKPSTKKRKRKNNEPTKDAEEGEMKLDENCEEKWFRRIKRKKTYFQVRFFDSVPEVLRESKKISHTAQTNVLQDDKHEDERKINNSELANETEAAFERNQANTCGPLNLRLADEDYISLKNSNFLTDLAIDALIESKIEIYGRKHEVLSVPSSVGYWIVGGKTEWSECPFDLKTQESTRYVFIPYNCGNKDVHWCLAVADVRNKEFYNFDSLGQPGKKNGKPLENTLHFLKEMNRITKCCFGQVDFKGWIDYSDTITYQKQKDNFNCGIYVINYTEQVLRLDIHPRKELYPVDIKKCRQKYSEQIEELNKRSSAQTMENGLLSNPQHYCNPGLKGKGHLVVGIMKNSSMGRFSERFFVEDFDTLSDRNWFNDTMVDCCNASFVNENQFCFAVGETSIALQERIRFTVTFKPVSEEMNSKNIVFLPLNIEGQHHYSVIVLDMKNRKISHLDPISKDIEANHRMCERVLKFFRKRNEMVKDDKIRTENFEIVDTYHPMQEDAVNCGAYVVFFISEISRMNCLKDICSRFDPNSFRKELQKRCLRFSQDMTNICVICGNKEKKNHDWCQCKKCHRWLHYPCLNTDVPFVDMDKSTFDVFCPFCEEN